VIDIVEILIHWYAGRSQHELAASLGVDRQGYCKVDLAVGGVSCLTRARRSGVPEEGDSGPG
jgi:hypothetical protein